MRAPSGILGLNGKAKRLMKWMKSVGFAAVLIALLGLGLMASAVVCPLWMLAASQDHTPCSHEGSAPESCPPSICQASSPFVVSNLSVALPLLVELDSSMIEAATNWKSPAIMPTRETRSESPPSVHGSLFLRTHSLLI